MTRHTRPTRLSSAMRVALSSFLLASISHTAQAEDAVTLCSCSPTTFQFVLSLDQNCDQNDLDGNAGIDGSLCFLEEGVALPAAPDLEQSDDEADGPIRRVLYRALQDTDPIVEIVSVQFLEFDTSGDLVVINQDDTYADVSLGDGALLNFTSASSFLDTSIPLEDQTSSPALVAGGASMILYGKTASGNIVRNRIIWIYDMNCGRDNSPVNTGDEIGWVTVGDLSNAWPAFCPALPPGSPTIAPKTNEPTDSPTVSPIKSPTLSPTEKKATMAPTAMSMITQKPHDHSHPIFSAKSSKVSKTLKAKSSKSTKSVKSAKSSKSKGSKGSKSDSDSGDVVGKTGKAAGDYMLYDNTGKVTGFSVEKAESSSSSSLYCSTLGLVMTLMTSYLFAR